MDKIETLEYSSYELQPAFQLNRFKEQARAGILLRVNQSFFLDYHPWQEFGDLTVSDFLKKLRETKTLPAYLLSDLDLEIKREQIAHHAFYNHKLIYKESDIDEKVKIVKLKYLGEMTALSSLIEHCFSLNIRVRVDFNNALTLTECLELWENISRQDLIDYLEDPLPFSEGDWNILFKEGIPLASDRNPWYPKITKAKIFKSNRDSYPVDAGDIIYSNYMGHDLGMYHCYLNLMAQGNLKLCHGIYTPGIYLNQDEIFYKDQGMIRLKKKSIEGMYKKLKELKWTTIF